MTAPTPPASALVRPFTVSVPDSEVDDLKQRLARTRWPDPETVGDWSQGVRLENARSLVGYWERGYDWRRFESGLNRFPQFLTEIDGLDIHFIHVRSRNPGAMPLILTHGWPGSIVEFLKLIGPLTDQGDYRSPKQPQFWELEHRPEQQDPCVRSFIMLVSSLGPPGSSTPPSSKTCSPTGTRSSAWSAVHRLDAARLYRIALAQAPAGALLNAVEDEAVPFRDVVAAIGRSLDLPARSVSAEEAAAHFGMPLAIFARLDVPASSKRTREQFGWEPAEPGLIADIDARHNANAASTHQSA